MLRFIGSLFSFKGKLMRLPYLLRILTLIAASYLLNILAGALFAVSVSSHNISPVGGAFVVYVIVILLLVLWSDLSLSWRRARDIGSNPWLILLLSVIPAVNVIIAIILFIAPSKHAAVIGQPIQYSF